MIKRPRKQKKFSIIGSAVEVKKLMDGNLPGDDECYKFLSDGGFSSISFIKYIAEKNHIDELTVSTLRVGKKELQHLEILKKANKLNKCNFIVGSVAKNDGKANAKYQYFDNFSTVCERNNWSFSIVNNHSKILLFDTENGKYVIETSSNLNENPKMEQFSFEKDEALYDFYYVRLKEMMR